MNKSFTAWQPEWAGKLQVGDFKRELVSILFEDNSRCDFEYAFYRYENDWLVVYTEHCGYPCFPKNSYIELDGTDRTKENRS
jgi:hypothetical protein